MEVAEVEPGGAVEGLSNRRPEFDAAPRKEEQGGRPAVGVARRR